MHFFFIFIKNCAFFLNFEHFLRVYFVKKQTTERFTTPGHHNQFKSIITSDNKQTAAKVLLFSDMCKFLRNF